jgi:hypothetical protein
MLDAPHDTFFRTVFRRARTAASWLRSVLPAPTVEALDWRTLAPVGDVAFGVRLRRHHADAVFGCRLRANRAVVLILIEHKAHRDPMLDSQVLRYAVHLRRASRPQRPGAPSAHEPLVLAAVLHHGPIPLRPATTHPDLADLPREASACFRAFQPRLEFALDDLTACDESGLRRHGLLPHAQLALLSLRCLRDSTGDEVLAAFARWAELMRAVDRDPGPDAIDALCWYALAVTDVEPEALTEHVSRILHRPEESIMSTLERTYQKGKAEGRAEGEATGRAQVLLRQLERRFGTLRPEVVRRVAAAPVEALDEWTLRVLDADSLARVFGD